MASLSWAEWAGRLGRGESSCPLVSNRKSDLGDTYPRKRMVVPNRSWSVRLSNNCHGGGQVMPSDLPQSKPRNHRLEYGSASPKFPERCVIRNSYATPTPVTDGERVYAVFHDGTVVAVDFSGKRLWRNSEVKFFSLHGLGPSPLLVNGQLVMPFDGSSQESERVGWKIPWERGRPVTRCDLGCREVERSSRPFAGRACHPHSRRRRITDCDSRGDRFKVSIRGLVSGCGRSTAKERESLHRRKSATA